jgi:hypothetical protein
MSSRPLRVWSDLSHRRALLFAVVLLIKMKPNLVHFLCLGALATIAMSADDAKAPAHLNGLTALSNKPVEVYEAPELPCSIGGGGDGIFPVTPDGSFPVTPENSEKSPHHDFSIIVCVNQVLLDYRRKNPEGTQFPIGSVLLKEKFVTGTTAAKLYTRMERKSLNGEVKDWEFSAKSLDQSENPESFKAARCMTCHDDFDETGYVSETSISQLESFLKPAVPNADHPE